MSREPSLLLWDISTKAISLGDTKRRTAGSVADSNPRSYKPHTINAARTSGPTELSLGEGVLSLRWIPDSQDTLLAGIGPKYLKLFDVRCGSSHTVSTARGAHCLAVNPNAPNIFASFSRTAHAIKIWDRRQFSEPIYSIATDRTEFVSRLAWCPTRPGLLGALFQNDQTVQLYDTYLMQTSDLDAAWGSKPIWKRRTDHQHADAAVHFDWHPHHRGKLMTITARGTVGVCTAREPAVCDISSTGVLSYGSVGITSSCHSTLTTCNTTREVPTEIDAVHDIRDISTRMHANAAAGYYATKIEDNVDISSGDTGVQRVWLWLQCIQDGLEGGFVGIRDALASGTENSSSLGVGELKVSVHDTITSRARALSMCGWVVINDVSALNKRLGELESAGEYERAAAVAIFHQRIPRAIQSLTSGAKNRTDASSEVLLSTAMSLAGYAPSTGTSASSQVAYYGVPQQDSLWHETCRRLIPQLPNPHCRAALKFLSCDKDDLREIIQDTDLHLQDRLGFACRYLPDEELDEFLNGISQQSLAAGMLDGVLVDGLSPRGLDLIAAYVDRTADVQTACLLTSCVKARVSPDTPIANALANDVRVSHWLVAYQDLLDTWQLWVERAKFDVDRLRTHPGTVPQHVYVRCGYCSASVTPSHTPGGGGGGSGVAGAGNRRTPTSACPSCSRPLPKCSVCLLRLGSATEGFVKSTAFTPSKGKVQRFGWWISWCQGCRHGGHAEHLDDWFAGHTTCPVAGCTCQCTQYEAVASLGPFDRNATDEEHSGINVTTAQSSPVSIVGHTATNNTTESVGKPVTDDLNLHPLPC
eukprot:m.890823 g.890823  ORF g.890823 m.890823 type:complete len:815 (+) comp23652_c1_seq21:726-3170(+)